MARKFTHDVNNIVTGEFLHTSCEQCGIKTTEAQVGVPCANAPQGKEM
jgi:hypothetical protein